MGSLIGRQRDSYHAGRHDYNADSRRDNGHDQRSLETVEKRLR